METWLHKSLKSVRNRKYVHKYKTHLKSNFYLKDNWLIKKIMKYRFYRIGRSKIYGSNSPKNERVLNESIVKQHGRL